MTPELHLLGGAVLRAADGTPVTGAAAQSRRLAVLAILAEAWPAVSTRDRVIGLLWPDQDEAGARRLLTQALYELRRELGPVIGGSARDLVLLPEALRVDVIDFRVALRDGDLERAASLYGGPLLAGMHLRGAVEFERWLDAARERLAQEAVRAVASLVARHEASGSTRDAARWASRLVQLSPFDAEAVLRLMRLHDESGDHGAALAAAAAYERRMREELDLAPAPQVPAQVAAMRARSAPSPAAQPATPSVVTVPLPSPPSPAIEPPIALAEPAPVAHVERIDRGVPLRRLAWLAGACALGALGIVVLARRNSPRPPRADASRLLVLQPVRAPAGDTAATRIARDVTAMLASTVRGVEGVRVLAADSLASADTGWARLRGDAVVSGSALRIDAELRVASQPSRPVLVSVSGSRDSVLALAERLAIGLLPALYPGAADSVPAASLARWHSAAALRHFLEGETAMRRGDFDAAFTAFGSATALEPSLGIAWYRRALAAEQAHRTDDADRSIVAAQARSASLDARERRLVDGYAQWRAGDGRAAEETFRAMLHDDSRDRDAWWHLAEIGYHAGPLHGRPVDEARDAWREVVSMDSSDYLALVHMLRLEARAGDTAAVRALLARPPLRGSSEASAAESRVIAAVAIGTRDAEAAARRDLDALPDYSLGYVQGVVAGLLEQPARAEPIARMLTRPTYPGAVQGEGHLALAQLALARGRWRDAMHELRRAEPYSPVAAAWSRAYFATLPFLVVPPAVRKDALDGLAAAASGDATAPMSLQLAVDAPAAGAIGRYLHGLLRVADGQGASMPLECGSGPAVAASTRALCDDLRRGLRAESLRRDGDYASALAEVEGMGMVVPYQFAGRSMFFARSRERYLHARLLEQSGRLQEAYTWYAAMPHGSWMDYIYLAPAHLRRGQIRERLGDRAAAAEHYRRALALWDAPDPELAGLRAQALAGLKRIASR